MRAIVSVICCLLIFGQVAQSAFTGKVAFWDSSANSQTGNKIKHTTRTVNVGSVVEIPSGFDRKYEAIVHLRSGAALKHESVLSVIKASASAEVLTNVRSADSTIESAIAKGTHMGDAQVVSITELDALFREGSVLKDGETNAYIVSFDATETDSTALSTLLSTTSNFSAGQVLYIASEEAATTAELPTGHYARQLSSIATSATKPVVPATGAEFSIYYEGTYLYITPDIFTGLLTMLFMFFVVLIGLNCLGDIQGMSSFYDRVPSNGKEA